MQYRSITEIKPNPQNPRIIKDDKFAKLVKSIKEFPQMLEKRPLVCFTDVDGKFVVLGGNMRLKAAKEVGLKELPILLADDWTEEQKKEFLIKDNVGFGEWQWDELQADWDVQQLSDWGLDIPDFSTSVDFSDEEVDLSTFKDSADKYLNNQVRQILLTFDIDTHKKTLERLLNIQKDFDLKEDNSTALIKLLDYYEENRS